MTLYVIRELIKSPALHKVWQLVSENLKIITMVGLCFFLLSLLNSVFLYSYKLLIQLQKFPACYYVWSGQECFWAYVSYSVAVVGHSVFHFMLLIERCYATSVEPTKGRKPYLGYVLAVCMLILAPLLQILSYDPKMINVDRPYCAGVVQTANGEIAFVVTILILIDLSITGGDFLLLLHNKWRTEKARRRISDFNLHHSFKLKEMEISMTLIFPFSVAHSITYTIVLLVFWTYIYEEKWISAFENLAYMEVINLVRTILNFFLMLFFLLYIRIRSDQKQTLITTEPAVEAHFKEFKRIIS